MAMIVFKVGWVVVAKTYAETSSDLLLGWGGSFVTKKLVLVQIFPQSEPWLLSQ